MVSVALPSPAVPLSPHLAAGEKIGAADSRRAAAHRADGTDHVMDTGYPDAKVGLPAIPAVSALRQTLAQVTDVSKVARQAASQRWILLPGLALTSATSLLCAATVTPTLLQISGGAQGLTETLRSLPVVGPAIAQALGVSSYMGLFASSACLLSVTLALLTAETPRDQRVKWALAQACQGFALSPFWQLAVQGALGAAAPGLLVAAACTVGVSLILADGLAGERQGWLSAVALASLTAAGAPLGAQLAVGVGLAEAVANAGAVLAIGALVGTCLVWRHSVQLLEDDSTAELRRHRCASTGAQVLNLPGNAGRATVFVDDPTLQTMVQSMAVNVQAGLSCGSKERLLLAGPPGTGKSQCAMAIANALGAPLYAPSIDVFLDTDSPASRVREIFAQARLLRDRQTPRRPLVLCFDEAEKLFYDRAKAKADDKEARHVLTDAFNAQLEGLDDKRNDNIVVIVCTNYPEVTDAAIQSRFTRVDLAPPDAATVRAILAASWPTAAAAYANFRHLTPYQPDAAALDAMVAACLPQTGEAGPAKAATVKATDAADSLGDNAKGEAVVGRDLSEAIAQAYRMANALPGEALAAMSPERRGQMLQDNFLRAIAARRRQRALAAKGPAA